MKALKIFVLILGLAIISQTKSEAQHLITSLGVVQNWYLPNKILHAVEWDYPGYVIAHAHKFYRYGSPYFNIILQRRNVFLELQFNYFGRVVHRARYNHFPLTGHICTTHCGYHHAYYHKYAHVQMHHHASVNKVYVHKHHGNNEHHNAGLNHQRPQPANRRSEQQVRTHVRSQENGSASAVRRSMNQPSESGRQQSGRTKDAKYTARGTRQGGRD